MARRTQVSWPFGPRPSPTDIQLGCLITPSEFLTQPIGHVLGRGEPIGPSLTTVRVHAPWT